MTTDRRTFITGSLAATAALAVPRVLAETAATAAPAQPAAPTSTPPSPVGNLPRERVLGLGGFFFRAENPKALAEWYERALGVTQVPQDYTSPGWSQEAGFTAFAPFAKTTKYFGKPEQGWMLNFRVRSLDAMVAQLRGMDVAVKVDPETYPNGRFARLHDPEGNPIELWEPKSGT